MSSEKRYGGAFAPKAADRMTAGVESVDMSKLWREKAQIKHLQEILNEASDPIDTRPGVYKSAALEGVDFSDSIDKACHRACPDLWDIYSRCKDKKKSHEECAGWYKDYTTCLDKCSSKLTLKAMQAVMADDPSGIAKTFVNVKANSLPY